MSSYAAAMFQNKNELKMLNEKKALNENKLI